jgi:hypothetical protein
MWVVRAAARESTLSRGWCDIAALGSFRWSLHTELPTLDRKETSMNSILAADVAAQDPVVHPVGDTAARAVKGLRTPFNQRDIVRSARITFITASVGVRVAKPEPAGGGHIKS